MLNQKKLGLGVEDFKEVIIFDYYIDKIYRRNSSCWF